MIKNNALKVELRSAKIPYLGLIADHYWFVIITDTKKERWEVWQNPHCCKTSWGHLHLNLLPFDSAVGSGQSRVEYVFSGLKARVLAKTIQHSITEYKNLFCYRYWPGPNSNTYVQNMLDKANIDLCLSATAIGKDFYGWFDYSKKIKVIRVSTPLLGIKISYQNFYECNILSFTFGIYLNPIKIIHPFSRYTALFK
ncbi:DUF3750 domain-containing protein [Pseudoalteromonas sp. C2R02]|uniref:DUF3750 domain-containing protein n=1 Tax=Pseudoalteromonas sp. C2R02 TaxID=2841565 RepID=UPI001C098A51|nr:DUF3750 domain-containing protein [Pseudoalteromonas sp. C2R02]MBU2968560.1 DUF3750 domain-containing protein [Pseudoalteromonas sp. C2R02]